MMPGKRHKHGQRAYLTVDDKKLTTKFRIDDLQRIQTDLQVPGFGNTKRLVAEMLSEVLGKNYALCCDQFFTPVLLFSWLLSQNTPATGTLKANRKFASSALKVKKRPRDDIMSRQAGHLTIIRYQGTKTKCVRILTTQGNADLVDVTIRRKVDNVWQEVTIQKPRVIAAC